jgi:hypothetical protein
MQRTASSNSTATMISPMGTLVPPVAVLGDPVETKGEDTCNGKYEQKLYMSVLYRWLGIVLLCAELEIRIVIWSDILS